VYFRPDKAHLIFFSRGNHVNCKILSPPPCNSLYSKELAQSPDNLISQKLPGSLLEYRSFYSGFKEPDGFKEP
jgi:hypothetical protein